MKSVISKTFTFLGIILILFSLYLVYQRYNPQRLSFKNYQVENEKIVDDPESSISVPKLLIIKDADINTPIVYANPPKDGRWETTRNGVSYLNSTPLPGSVGNSVMYGHNSTNILGNLGDASPGSVVEVVFENGAVEVFSISTIQIVGPNQADILNQTNDKRLTIYTCIGFLDSKRLVVTAQKI